MLNVFSVCSGEFRLKQTNQKQRNKKKQYLGMNLPKEAKDLYSENYKILMKEIKDDTNRWRDIPCSCTGRINIVKMEVP